jgi:5-formyltetrahydrofolate cyclo-ligase
MAEQRGCLSASERDQAARAVFARLWALPPVEAARARAASGEAACLSGYVATRGEVDPAAALDAARAVGLAVALPRIDTTSPPRLRFHRTRGVADLGDGPYGLTEPLPTCPEVAVEDVDIMLVPGLAFDACGRRVGHGGGYYDAAGRRLREARRPAHRRAGVMIGLAYEFQIVEACPVEEHDVAVDFVVTERRVLSAGAAS